MVTISSSPIAGNVTNAGAISGNAIGSTIGTIPAGVSGPGYSFLNGQGASSRNNLQALGATNIENQLKRASAQNEAYLNEAKDLYEPYRQAGINSLDEYMKLLLGGVDGLKNDQNFQDMRDLTERQVMANRAVGGLLRSGGTASALNDSLLKFANKYYGDRLEQLKGGVGIGQYGTTGQTNILEKLGGNATDLASALANIQMQRESNDATIKAAREQAGATTSAAKAGNEAATIGAVIGAIGSIFSDRRLKTDLKLVGKSNNGLNIYLGRYTKESGLDDNKRHLFLIAQEVMEVVPEAVTLDESGYYKVNYAKALEVE